MGSRIIHLADRVVVRISKDEPILGQIEGICEAISKDKNKAFLPELVDIMLTLAKHDYIWMELTSDFLETILRRNFLHRTRELVIDELLDFAMLICRLIDFKSEFTATHSSGVAATAVEIAKLLGFSTYEQKLMRIAAYLHDLGKIAIPSEILEKKNILTGEEWHVMRSHAYYTYQILEPVDTLNTICTWGALHQERLDGSGYPFGIKADELPLGARIMAVADVFTAITENRPYRLGMDKKHAVDVLRSMASNSELDKTLVNLILEHYDEINETRDISQKEAIREFDLFQKKIDLGGAIQANGII
jgi:HD-GYP domain-containing protein (c-di-GMP phosphodiesterase class II)